MYNYFGFYYEYSVRDEWWCGISHSSECRYTTLYAEIAGIEYTECIYPWRYMLRSDAFIF